MRKTKFGKKKSVFSHQKSRVCLAQQRLQNCKKFVFNAQKEQRTKLGIKNPHQKWANNFFGGFIHKKNCGFHLTHPVFNHHKTLSWSCFTRASSSTGWSSYRKSTAWNMPPQCLVGGCVFFHKWGIPNPQNGWFVIGNPINVLEFLMKIGWIHGWNSWRFSPWVFMRPFRCHGTGKSWDSWDRV